jgi:hypothetical protein
MPHSIPKDLLIANAPAATTHIFAFFIERLKGANRVVVETSNAFGEIDASYISAPEILESWNSRADLPTLATENALLRDALKWVAASSGCQASRIIAAAAVEGTT